MRLHRLKTASCDYVDEWAGKGIVSLGSDRSPDAAVALLVMRKRNI